MAAEDPFSEFVARSHVIDPYIRVVGVQYAHERIHLCHFVSMDGLEIQFPLTWSVITLSAPSSEKNLSDG